MGVGRKPGVGRDHHPLAGTEALGHLHLLGVAAANNDGPAVRLAAAGAPDEGVGAAGWVSPRIRRTSSDWPRLSAGGWLTKANSTWKRPCATCGRTRNTFIGT